MSIRFIHAADLHIDSPMKGLGEKDSNIAKKVRTATRDAFARLVQFAIDEKVSFIVIAGDIFDGEWDDVETGIWAGRQFKLLMDAAIPVYIVYGNHDGKNQILRNMKENVFPSNVHIFSSKEPERFFFIDRISGERVAITGQGYSAWNCPENLAANYPAPEPGVYNVAALHTGLGGERAGSYAPTTVGELRSLGYNYWALGHQHRREVLCDEPDCWIGYSGVVQTRHVNESVNQDGTTSKGFFLVEVADGRRIGEPQFVSVDSLRWFRIDVDLSEIDESEPEEAEAAMVELFLDDLRQALAEAGGALVAARVRFFGRSCLYGRLTGLYDSDTENPTRLRLYQSLSSLGGEVWLESLDVSGVKPLIPDDFWNRGVLRSIHDEVMAQNEQLDSFKDNIDGKKQGVRAGKAPLKALDPLVKKLALYKTDLLCGRRPDPSVQPEKDADGIALDDPEQYKKWNLEALDTLADVLKSVEEDV